jgi:ribosomal protein S18 acetylase RimI-like enzyme
MERRGSDVVWLGVWERNPRAIAFYRKFEFREAGEHVFPVGNDPQRDIVLVRPLARGSEICRNGR